MSNNTRDGSTDKAVEEADTGEKGMSVKDNVMQLGTGQTYLQSGATERTEKARKELEKDHEASAKKEYKNKNKWFGFGAPPGQELQEQRRESTSEVGVTEEEKAKPLRGVRDELDTGFKRDADKTKKRD